MTDTPSSVLIKTRDLAGKPIISLQGEEAGTIARVIVDPIRGKVVGLTVNVKGWFKGEKGLEFESVNSFGDYAITLQRTGQIVPLDSLPTVEKLAQDYSMYNMRIITAEGKLIGTVDDFYFDSETGEIKKYILTGGVIKNLFKGRASIPAESVEKIGKDAIIAVSKVEEFIQKEDSGIEDNIENLKDDLGSLKGNLEHWKDDFEKVWDKTRTKTQELSKTLGENIITAAKSGKGTGNLILSKTGQVLSEKKDKLKASYETWLNRLQAVKNGPEKLLTDGDISSLVGLNAGETVVDDAGAVIVAQDTLVTREIIESAQKAGKTKELLISVATRDLEDQIKSIEKEAENG